MPDIKTTEEKFEHLEIPLEPKELKRQAQLAYREYSNMDEDSLVLWLKDKGFCSYLYTTCKWKNILNANGLKWQNFLRIISIHKRDLIRWVRDEKSGMT